MKLFKPFLVLTMIICVSAVFAQDNIKQGGNEPVKYYYSNGNGNTVNPMFTVTPQSQNQVSQEKQALLNEIRQSRLNNDVVKTNELQSRLDKQNGSSFSSGVNDPSKTGVVKTFEQTDKLPIPFQGDYVVSTFVGGGAGLWSIATMTSSRSSTIFAAVSRFVSGATDSVNVYASYDGGATWVRKGASGPWVATVDARSGELDIEVVISGADTMAYVVTGYNFNNHALVLLQRFNVGTGAVATAAWDFGGALSTSVNTYYPRVVSDNVIYAGNAFVYVTVSHDSLIAGGNLKVTQRFGVYLTPFTSTTITFRVANAGGGGFFWFSGSTSPDTYLWQDMCFYDAPGDRIYSTFNHIGSGASNVTIYIAWSNDYGVTNAGSLAFAETAGNIVMRTKVASNAGTGQQTLCVGYRRLFSGSDWDFRGQFSTTGGTTTGSFTASYPEFTGANCLLPDLQSFKNTAGRYAFAWVDSTGTGTGDHFYRQTTNSGSTYTTTQLQTNNVAGDRSFGGTKAGYTTGSDPCLVIWSAANGTNTNASRLICSTVGISGNNNGIPELYSLNQNFPNPFNPTTSIRFAIPRSGLVKLLVYDMLGREVATLVNANLEAGEYNIDFNASDLPSGVYFYRLTAGDFTDTRKMTLIK
jgi:type IX secretion system substrate protein